MASNASISIDKVVSTSQSKVSPLREELLLAAKRIAPVTISAASISAGVTSHTHDTSLVSMSPYSPKPPSVQQQQPIGRYSTSSPPKPLFYATAPPAPLSSGARGSLLQPAPSSAGGGAAATGSDLSRDALLSGDSSAPHKKNPRHGLLRTIEVPMGKFSPGLRGTGNKGTVATRAGIVNQITTMMPAPITQGTAAFASDSSAALLPSAASNIPSTSRVGVGLDDDDDAPYCSRAEHEEELAAFTNQLAAVLSKKLADQREALVAAIMTKAAGLSTNLVRQETMAMSSRALRSIVSVNPNPPTATSVINPNPTSKSIMSSSSIGARSTSLLPSAAPTETTTTSGGNAILPAKRAQPPPSKRQPENAVPSSTGVGTHQQLSSSPSDNVAAPRENLRSEEKEASFSFRSTKTILSDRANTHTVAGSDAAVPKTLTQADGGFHSASLLTPTAASVVLISRGNNNSAATRDAFDTILMGHAETAVSSDDEDDGFHHSSEAERDADNAAKASTSAADDAVGEEEDEEEDDDAFVTSLIIRKYALDAQIVKPLLQFDAAQHAAQQIGVATSELLLMDAATSSNSNANANANTATAPLHHRNSNASGKAAIAFNSHPPSPQIATATMTAGGGGGGGAFDWIGSENHRKSVTVERNSKGHSDGTVVVSEINTKKFIDSKADTAAPATRSTTAAAAAPPPPLLPTALLLTRKGVSIAVDPLQKLRLDEKYRQQGIVASDAFRRELKAATSALKLASKFIGQTQARTLIREIVEQSTAHNAYAVASPPSKLVEGPSSVGHRASASSSSSPLSLDSGAAAATLKEMLLMSCAEAAVDETFGLNAVDAAEAAKKRFEAANNGGGNANYSRFDTALLLFSSSPGVRRRLERFSTLKQHHEEQNTNSNSDDPSLIGSSPTANATSSASSPAWSPRDALTHIAAKKAVKSKGNARRRTLERIMGNQGRTALTSSSEGEEDEEHQYRLGSGPFLLETLNEIIRRHKEERQETDDDADEDNEKGRTATGKLIVKSDSKSPIVVKSSSLLDIDVDRVGDVEAKALKGGPRNAAVKKEKNAKNSTDAAKAFLRSDTDASYQRPPSTLSSDHGPTATREEAGPLLLTAPALYVAPPPRSTGKGPSSSRDLRRNISSLNDQRNGGGGGDNAAKSDKKPTAMQTKQSSKANFLAGFEAVTGLGAFFRKLEKSDGQGNSSSSSDDDGDSLVMNENEEDPNALPTSAEDFFGLNDDLNTHENTQLKFLKRSHRTRLQANQPLSNAADASEEPDDDKKLPQKQKRGKSKSSISTRTAEEALTTTSATAGARVASASSATAAKLLLPGPRKTLQLESSAYANSDVLGHLASMSVLRAHLQKTHPETAALLDRRIPTFDPKTCEISLGLGGAAVEESAATAAGQEALNQPTKAISGSRSVNVSHASPPLAAWTASPMSASLIGGGGGGGAVAASMGSSFSPTTDALSVSLLSAQSMLLHSPFTMDVGANGEATTSTTAPQQQAPPISASSLFFTLSSKETLAEVRTDLANITRNNTKRNREVAIKIRQALVDIKRQYALIMQDAPAIRAQFEESMAEAKTLELHVEEAARNNKALIAVATNGYKALREHLKKIASSSSLNPTTHHKPQKPPTGSSSSSKPPLHGRAAHHSSSSFSALTAGNSPIDNNNSHHPVEAEEAGEGDHVTVLLRDLEVLGCGLEELTNEEKEAKKKDGQEDTASAACHLAAPPPRTTSAHSGRRHSSPCVSHDGGGKPLDMLNVTQTIVFDDEKGGEVGKNSATNVAAPSAASSSHQQQPHSEKDTDALILFSSHSIGGHKTAAAGASAPSTIAFADAPTTAGPSSRISTASTQLPTSDGGALKSTMNSAKTDELKPMTLTSLKSHLAYLLSLGREMHAIGSNAKAATKKAFPTNNLDTMRFLAMDDDEGEVGNGGGTEAGGEILGGPPLTRRAFSAEGDIIDRTDAILTEGRRVLKSVFKTDIDEHYYSKEFKKKQKQLEAAVSSGASASDNTASGGENTDGDSKSLKSAASVVSPDASFRNTTSQSRSSIRSRTSSTFSSSNSPPMGSSGASTPAAARTSSNVSNSFRGGREGRASPQSPTVVAFSNGTENLRMTSPRKLHLTSPVAVEGAAKGGGFNATLLAEQNNGRRSTQASPSSSPLSFKPHTNAQLDDDGEQPIGSMMSEGNDHDADEDVFFQSFEDYDFEDGEGSTMSNRGAASKKRGNSSSRKIKTGSQKRLGKGKGRFSCDTNSPASSALPSPENISINQFDEETLLLMELGEATEEETSKQGGRSDDVEAEKAPPSPLSRPENNSKSKAPNSNKKRDGGTTSKARKPNAKRPAKTANAVTSNPARGGTSPTNGSSKQTVTIPPLALNPPRDDSGGNALLITSPIVKDGSKEREATGVAIKNTSNHPHDRAVDDDSEDNDLVNSSPPSVAEGAVSATATEDEGASMVTTPKKRKKRKVIVRGSNTPTSFDTSKLSRLSSFATREKTKGKHQQRHKSKALPAPKEVEVAVPPTSQQHPPTELTSGVPLKSALRKKLSFELAPATGLTAADKAINDRDLLMRQTEELLNRRDDDDDGDDDFGGQDNADPNAVINGANEHGTPKTVALGAKPVDGLPAAVIFDTDAAPKSGTNQVTPPPSMTPTPKLPASSDPPIVIERRCVGFAPVVDPSDSAPSNDANNGSEPSSSSAAASAASEARIQRALLPPVHQRLPGVTSPMSEDDDREEEADGIAAPSEALLSSSDRQSMDTSTTTTRSSIRDSADSAGTAASDFGGGSGVGIQRTVSMASATSGAFSHYTSAGWGTMGGVGGGGGRNAGQASVDSRSGLVGQLPKGGNQLAGAGVAHSSIASNIQTLSTMSMLDALSIGGKPAGDYLKALRRRSTTTTTMTKSQRRQSSIASSSGPSFGGRRKMSASSSSAAGDPMSVPHQERRRSSATNGGGGSRSGRGGGGGGMALPPYSIPRRMIDIHNLSQVLEILISEAGALRDAIEADQKRLERRAKRRQMALERGDIDAQLRYAIFDDEDDGSDSVNEGDSNVSQQHRPRGRQSSHNTSGEVNLAMTSTLCFGDSVASSSSGSIIALANPSPTKKHQAAIDENSGVGAQKRSRRQPHDPPTLNIVNVNYNWPLIAPESQAAANTTTNPQDVRKGGRGVVLTDVDRFRIRRTLTRTEGLIKEITALKAMLNATIQDKSNVKDELQSAIEGEIADCETVMIRTNAEIRKAKMNRKDLVTRYWEWRKAVEVGDWRAGATFYEELLRGPKRKEIGIQCEIQAETLPVHLRRFVKLMKRDGDLNARLIWLELKIAELDNVTQRIATELECSICRQPFHDPVVMRPCGHAYCQGCFEHAPELRLFPTDSSVYQCCVCGAVTTEPASLSDNVITEIQAKMNVKNLSYTNVSQCLRAVKVALARIQQRSVKKTMSAMSAAILAQHMADEGVANDGSPMGGVGGNVPSMPSFGK